MTMWNVIQFTDNNSIALDSFEARDNAQTYIEGLIKGDYHRHGYNDEDYYWWGQNDNSPKVKFRIG